jgi:hypothetical protein
MTHQGELDDRLRETRARLSEIDRLLKVQQGTVRELTVELAMRKEAIAALRQERRTIAVDLARLRAGSQGSLEEHVLAHAAAGMSNREIARALRQSPAVVSRLIERVKAAERKKKKAT